MRVLIVLLMLLSASLTHAESSAEKTALSQKILSPLIVLLRSGDLGKASLPHYNKYRESKGRRPLSYEEVEPIFRQSASASESVYIKAFSSEFTLQELQFLQRLFATKIGSELMRSLSQGIASGIPQKPDLSSFTNTDIVDFESAAKEDYALFTSMTARLERVNAAAQKNFAEFSKAHPELKLPDEKTP